MAFAAILETGFPYVHFFQCYSLRLRPAAYRNPTLQNGMQIKGTRFFAGKLVTKSA